MLSRVPAGDKMGMGKIQQFKEEGQVWWYIPVIPALGRLEQKDQKLVDSLRNNSEILSQEKKRKEKKKKDKK
jgi:hypothetical protein